MRLNRFFFLFLFGVAACHPRPLDDMLLADVALKAAQKVKAEVLAPDTYRKAENFYLRAKKDYTDGYYESAKKFAHRARQIAEQAEYQSVMKQTELKGGIIEPESNAPNLENSPREENE